MTDAEWTASDDPDGMLAALGDRLSDRKRLLFAIGCLRLADNRVSPRARALADVYEKIVDAPGGTGLGRPFSRNLSAALGGDPAGILGLAFGLVPFGTRLLLRQVAAATRAAESPGADPAALSTRHAGQARLLRELHGPAVVRPTFEDGWRTESVVGLARAVADGPAFDRLPMLADALEDAGCDDATILAHCRDGNPIHGRGCWVVDLVLGRE